MARFLMDLCFKYQEGACPNENIVSARQAREVKPGEEIPTFPYGKNQDRLDQICEKCKERMFEIEAQTCPVCHGEIGPAIISEWTAASRTVFQYRCLNCDSLLFSFHKIA